MGPGGVLWGAVAGTLLVLAYRLVLDATLSLPFLTYYRTDTRIDAMLIGATVAALGALGALQRVPAAVLRAAAVAAILTLGVAQASYRWIETPFLWMKLRLGRARPAETPAVDAVAA